MTQRGTTQATMLELPWEEGPILGSAGAATAVEERPSPAPEPPHRRGWADAALASLDLETTGRDPSSDRILAVALYRQDAAGTPVPIVDTLVDPGSDVVIPEEAAAVHGITRERLLATSAPSSATVLARIHDALTELASEDTGVVIYNAPFDWPFLAAELARLDVPRSLPDCQLIDPLVLDRHVDRYRKGKRTLEAACQIYGVVLDNAHEASADALASLHVARAIGTRYPAVGELPLDALQKVQVDAHRVWRDGFNAYLHRIGADRDPISGSWPGLS